MVVDRQFHNDDVEADLLDSWAGFSLDPTNGRKMERQWMVWTCVQRQKDRDGKGEKQRKATAERWKGNGWFGLVSNGRKIGVDGGETEYE